MRRGLRHSLAKHNDFLALISYDGNMFKKLSLPPFLFLIFGLAFAFSTRTTIQAKLPPAYTLEQVKAHSLPTDCWMVIEGRVYDLSSYLPSHDRMLDIRSWCGRDATDDYNDKAGQDLDHSPRADQMLAEYQIGELANSQDTGSTASELAQPVAKKSIYNVWLPLLATTIFYLITLKFLAKPTHSFLWNSVLLLGLIPSFVFGLILALNAGGVKLLYLHVEWSIVFGTVCVLHLLYRLKIYLSQGKFALRKE